jgi:hypothetical protein
MAFGYEVSDDVQFWKVLAGIMMSHCCQTTTDDDLMLIYSILADAVHVHRDDEIVYCGSCITCLFYYIAQPCRQLYCDVGYWYIATGKSVRQEMVT